MQFFRNYSTFPEKWGSYEILSRSIVFSVMDVMDVNFWFEVHSSFFSLWFGIDVNFGLLRDLGEKPKIWAIEIRSWCRCLERLAEVTKIRQLFWNSRLPYFPCPPVQLRILLMLRGSLLGILPICINLAGINECFLAKQHGQNNLSRQRNCKEPDSP